MPSSLPLDARAAVLAWYDDRGRTLIFRSTRDPYSVLVSEVMAQQTQVSRVEPAWRRFLATYPTVDALAAATPADVVRAWQGMGYDRRALNLRRAARVIVDQHAGRVPSEIEALERLPGIGPYTARAVAAIAFGRPVGAVDTNVRRVLGRAVGGSSERPESWIQEVADASVDPARPGDWTHALMDLGATICRPRNPGCDGCPLRPSCAFAASPQRASGVRGGRANPSPSPPVFTSTTRWLRGRIVDRLRAIANDTWTSIDEPIGTHDLAAVRAALRALARDGLIELDPVDPFRARLSVT